MGHHHEGKSSIVPLIDRLNRYPIGLPDSETLRRILAILFSANEAYVASRFPLSEATLAELVWATGWNQEKLQPVLESMANKGLIMDLVYGHRTYYLLLPGLIGFFEFSFMKQRHDLPIEELAQLMHEYLFEDPDNRMGREFFGGATPLTRALPYEEHIPVESVVTTWESAREIIRQAGYGAVGMCYCRHKRGHLGRSCDKGAPTQGICISLGSAARFMVRRGFAEERQVEELLAVIDRARDLRLTHITDNIRHKPSFICNCCSCCCELLGGVMRGFPNGIAKSGYSIANDMEACIGCGLCAKACNVQVLEVIGSDNGSNRKRIAVKVDHCLGCGACISACPTGSLALVPVDRAPVPEKRKHLFTRILKDKKRFAPYVIAGIRTKLRRVLGLG